MFTKFGYIYKMGSVIIYIYFNMIL
uniref:Uncharacterized protein n=1 Tax=Rhizophora mucronata TaxID=61149 RepID=A0A2P2PXZ0_RHIMU